MSRARSIVTGLKAGLRDYLHDSEFRKFLPALRSDNDLFVVEFPKSGVTWLTFLMANIHLRLSADPRQATFFNVNDFIPDVEVARHTRSALLTMPGYRCFKSHASFTPRYRKVIYLLRDPRHVMVSYCTFLNSLRWWRGSLVQMVSHPEYGIDAWVRHVSGWIDGVDAATSFALVRYEDLLSDTAGELRRLYRLLGFELDDSILQFAVEGSTIEKMRRSELAYNAGRCKESVEPFVRQGPAGGPRSALPAETRQLIEDRAASIMARLNYKD